MTSLINSALAVLLCSALFSLNAAEWQGHVKWTSAVKATDPAQEEMAKIVQRLAPSFRYDCAPKQRCITLIQPIKNSNPAKQSAEMWYANDMTKEFSYVTGPLDGEATSLTWKSATNNDIDRDSDDNVKALLAAQFIFATKLEKIGDGGVIAGLPTTHYRIVKSGFVREHATAEIWVHDAITLPRARWDGDASDDEQTYALLQGSPIPLSIPLDTGIILKSSVTENGVNVVYTATEVVADKATFPQKSE